MKVTEQVYEVVRYAFHEKRRKAGLIECVGGFMELWQQCLLWRIAGVNRVGWVSGCVAAPTT